MTRDLGISHVALGFDGEGHHLVIDVSFSSLWKNATIRGVHIYVPGFAATQREQPKFDADRAPSQPAAAVSRLHGGAHTLVPFVVEDGAVGLAASRARPTGCCNLLAGLLLVGVFGTSAAGDLAHPRQWCWCLCCLDCPPLAATPFCLAAH